MSNLPGFDWHDDSGTLYIDDACLINFGGTPPAGSVPLVEKDEEISSVKDRKDRLHGLLHIRYGAVLPLKSSNCVVCADVGSDFERGREVGRKDGEDQWARQFNNARERNRARYGLIPFPTLTKLITSYLERGYDDVCESGLSSENLRLQQKLDEQKENNIKLSKQVTELVAKGSDHEETFRRLDVAAREARAALSKVFSEE